MKYYVEKIHRIENALAYSCRKNSLIPFFSKKPHFLPRPDAKKLCWTNFVGLGQLRLDTRQWLKTKLELKIMEARSTSSLVSFLLV